MNIGKLDRKIEIYEYTITRGPAGGEERTRQKKADAWAGIFYKNGSERVQAEKFTAITQMHFKIRYISGLDTTMEVDYDGDTYVIKYIEEIGRNTGQKLHVEKRK